MWNEDLPNQERPINRPAKMPGGTARRYLRMLLLWTPIAACMACLALAYLTWPDRQTPAVPVTGGSLPVAPTLTPDASGEPRPTATPADPEEPPLASFSYKVEAMRRLEDCTLAFHDFFLVEQVAIHDPRLIANHAWREEAAGAMLAFEQGCSTLGSLPPAPTAYGEADRWLKLAAGEVDSASSRFDVLLVENDHNQVFEIADHMLRFIEFTNNAERIIHLLEDRKEL